jgi:hypothetical protein
MIVEKTSRYGGTALIKQKYKKRQVFATTLLNLEA